MLFYALMAAVAGLVAWRFFGSPLSTARSRRSGWRLVPLVSGLAMIPLLALTLGGAVAITPLPFLLTIVAARRVGRPRGWTFLLGATLNVVWMFVFAGTAVLIGYDVLIA